jgi:branched-chain amino acid transport system permease protein
MSEASAGSADRPAHGQVVARFGRLTGARGLRFAGVLALLAAAVAFPQVFTDPAVTNYGVYALIFVAVASAWNTFSGFSGYISLGHAVFFGSGAYAIGIAARDWHVGGVAVFGLLPLAAAVGALIAVPFGLAALRVRRHTFIVITIAIFFIFQLMAYNFSFTDGSSGLDAPFLSWQPQTFNNPFYYTALACAVGATALAWLVRRSRFGLHLRAIRDDEDRARGLGVHAMRVKLAAFVLSGAVTALVGGVWFYYLAQVEPSTGFDPLFDLSVVLMAFLGGLGTVSGPVLGALIIEPGQLYLIATYTNAYLSEILLGALFLLVVLFMPRGIIPTGAEWMTRLRTRGRPAVTSASASPATPQASGPRPRGPEGPQRHPDAEDTPPAASPRAPSGVLPEAGQRAPSGEAPAREARR